MFWPPVARPREQVVNEIETAGGVALFVPADVSRASEVKLLFETAFDKFGRLDCAFNNAAAVPTSELVRTADLTRRTVRRFA